MYVDVSLSGMGTWWDNNAYAVPRHLSATWGLHIKQLEILNVLVLLRTLGCMWVNQAVHVHIDNQALIHTLKHGNIKYNFMRSVARSIWLIAAAKDVQVNRSHIAGIDNMKADVLSTMFEGQGNLNKLEMF